MNIRIVGFFLFFFPISSNAQLSIDVVYPKEGQVVSAHDSTFVFGSTNDPSAEVYVNQMAMQTFSNGAFLGMVPVQAGEFDFICSAQSGSETVELIRKVNVVSPFFAIPDDTIAIDSSIFLPKEDLELRSGDYVELMFKGTPGLHGTFSVPGLVEEGEMAEMPVAQEFYWGEAVFGNGNSFSSIDTRGLYRGGFFIEQGASVDSAEIYFNLQGNNGISRQMLIPARLTVRDDLIPRIAKLTEELTVARSGPGLGYQMFLPEDVRLHITGRKGNYYRAYLNDSEEVWVPEANIEFLPTGTPTPSSTIALIRSKSLPKAVRLTFYLQERLPFKIKQINNPSGLIVTIYGAVSNTDWIRYDFEDSIVREITWSQPATGVYEAKIDFNQKQHWGYKPYYSGKNLVLEVKKAPERLSLKKLVICVDPGHGPDHGSIGPTRLTEKEANLQLSLELKRRLERKGATVFLTRQANHGADLAVRSKMASLVEADIFISIHHNALPDGVNPFHNRGTSTYYYHPQSLALATSIQKRLLEKLKLKNFGLYYDNLAVCRITQMPSVLIETAFIMHPAEEMLINTRKYKEKAAEAIVKGLEDFLKQAKED